MPHKVHANGAAWQSTPLAHSKHTVMAVSRIPPEVGRCKLNTDESCKKIQGMVVVVSFGVSLVFENMDFQQS